MKKTQAILNSCKKQDEGSVQHSSIFSFPKMETPQGCNWQILCCHNKNLSYALCLSLNSHIHLIICISSPPHPTYTPGSNNSENISLKCIIMRLLNLKEKLYSSILFLLWKSKNCNYQNHEQSLHLSIKSHYDFKWRLCIYFYLLLFLNHQKVQPPKGLIEKNTGTPKAME